MEGCLGTSREGNVSPETVRRWVADVSNVLGAPMGRKKFQEFLENSEGLESLESGVQLLQFWEMCHDIVPDEALPARKKKKRWFSSKKSVGDETLFSKASDILTFAEENVNLDTGQLHRLNSAITEKDNDKVIGAIIEVKKQAVTLLESYHSLFKGHLLKQQGIMPST